MSIYDGLKEVQDELIKCMKCGNCQAVCPLYQETRREAAVARGKIKLAEAVLKGEVDYTPALAKRFDLCLTCQACSANCPCGVQVHRVVLAARAELARKRGLPGGKKAAFKVLKHPKLFHMGLRIGARTQGLVFKKNGAGMSPRFPVGLELRRVIPPLAGQSLKSRLAEVNPVPNPKMQVAFFSGCVTNYIYTNVGQAVVDVLQHNQVSVLFPLAQHCCGAPVLINGDVATALAMAKSHVEMFSKLNPDAIITVCGTCGESFRHNYVELLENDPVYWEQAKHLAAITYDIAEFLVDVIKIDQSKLGPVKMTATYHEPCHLGRGLGVTKQPLELLQSIPDLKFTPLQEPNRCCGGAGSFSLTNYPLSYDILGRKLKDIEHSGAATVVTGCGSCRMQLSDGLAQEKMSQQVLHTVEVLQQSYQNSKKR